MTTDIIRLDKTNVSLLSSLAPEVFDHPVKPAYLRDFVSDPRHLMYLAVAAGQVVGMVSAVEYFHPDKPAQLWINEVGVSPAYRRRGIGRQLVLTIIDEARRRGSACAWLGTDSDNAAGQACFHSVPGGENPQPFLLFEWDLTDIEKPPG